MLKFTLVAAVSLVGLSLAPLPVITGSAIAQQSCTAGAACRPTGGDGGASTYECGNELGLLRRVYEEQLEAIDDTMNVSVVPVCTGESYGALWNEGNAGALRQTIAQSETLMDALSNKNFYSDDVVGVRMTGEEKVILYVHEFHRR